MGTRIRVSWKLQGGPWREVYPQDNEEAVRLQNGAILAADLLQAGFDYRPGISFVDEDQHLDYDRTLYQRNGALKDLASIDQILGRALNYPKYSDDPKNFPPGPGLDPDQVCTGEHVPVTLAMEAATEIMKLRQKIKELNRGR